MNIRLIAVSLLTGLAASSSLAGQSPDEDAAALRREAVLRVESVTERLTRFEDRRLAVYSLARLGGSVCRFDATAAETVFQAGVALLAHDDKPEMRGEGRLEPWRLLEPGRFLVRRADHCDSGVGKRIAENLGGLPVGMIAAARESMSEGPRRAAELVAPLLAELPELAHDERVEVMRLLLRLQWRAPRTADAVYLRAVTEASSGVDGGPGAWSALGSYVYPLPSSSPLNIPRFRATWFGGSLLFDLGAEASSVALATAYLQGAAAAALRSENQRLAWRALVRSLLPKARALAPERAELLERWLAATTPAISAQQTPDDGEPPDPRAVVLITRFASAWSGGLLDSARAVADEVEDADLRARMQELILFGEAAETLAAGEHESALGVAAHLPAGLKRALLYYGAASLRLKAGDRESGFPLLLAALQDAAGVPPGDRARLLLQVAKSMAPVEREFALTVFSDAIRALNETESAGTDLRHRGFNEALRTGSFFTDVRLFVPGLEKAGLGVVDVLPAFTDGDLDRLETIVEELRDEPQLAGVLVILAESRLAQAYRYSPAAATSKVRLAQ